MTTCIQCLKPITGQYVYSPDKDDDKKFCSSKCMNEHYGRKCDECGKIQGSLIEKNGKKFCSTDCMNKNSSRETSEQVSDFWQKYKGWIIGGSVTLVLIIVLALIFGSKSKKKKKY